MYYLYTTGQGKTYPVEMGYQFIDSKDIVYNYEEITALCSSCGNFNKGGGCPPLAPKFEKISENKDFGIIIYAKLDSIYKPEKVKKNNNYYIHYRFQDVILSNLLTKLGYMIRDDFEDMLFLNNGYCMGCRSKCNFKKGENTCLKPERRTFSLEATGINVERTLKEQFDITLQWYNKENYQEIDYMVKAIGLFYKNREYDQKIDQFFLNYLNSLSSTKYKIGTSIFKDILMGKILRTVRTGDGSKPDVEI